jgi:hypothetical protein
MSPKRRASASPARGSSSSEPSDDEQAPEQAQQPQQPGGRGPTSLWPARALCAWSGGSSAAGWLGGQLTRLCSRRQALPAQLQRHRPAPVQLAAARLVSPATTTAAPAQCQNVFACGERERGRKATRAYSQTAPMRRATASPAASSCNEPSDDEDPRAAARALRSCPYLPKAPQHLSLCLHTLPHSTLQQ